MLPRVSCTFKNSLGSSRQVAFTIALPEGSLADHPQRWNFCGDKSGGTLGWWKKDKFQHLVVKQKESVSILNMKIWWSLNLEFCEFSERNTLCLYMWAGNIAQFWRNDQQSISGYTVFVKWYQLPHSIRLFPSKNRWWLMKRTLQKGMAGQTTLVLLTWKMSCLVAKHGVTGSFHIATAGSAYSVQKIVSESCHCS